MHTTSISSSRTRRAARAAAPFVILTVLAGAQAPASSTVSPPHFAGAEGNTSSGGPFGTGTLQDYLQIHDDLAGTPRIYRALAIRPDGLFPGTATAGYSLTLSMWMSSASRLANNIRPLFDENHGTDKTLVMDNRTINLPGRGVAGAMPRGFLNAIALDNGFPHPGTSGLTWHVRIHASNIIGSVSHDAAAGIDANPIPQNTFLGAGCRATGRVSAFTLNRTAMFDWPAGTGTITVSGSNAPASAPVFAVLGVSDQIWNGIPLPFLIPGSDTNPSGSCKVYTDALAILFTAASAAGAVPSTPIPVGLHPGLHGLNLITQLWALDASAAFGLVTSRAAVTHFVAPFGAVPVSKLSLAAGGGTPQIALQQSLVLRFDHD